MCNLFGFSANGELKNTDKIKVTSEVSSSALVEEEPTTTKTTVVTTIATTKNTVTETQIDTTKQQTTVKNNKNKLNVPDLNKQNGFKSWMPYTALSTSSPNYKMLVNRGYVDDNGLWKIDEYYCVALGSYYSKELGDIFEVTLTSGSTYKIVAVDHKDDAHTDSLNMYTTSNGCLTEFIVDASNLNKNIRFAGSVGALSKFSGKFVKIEKLGNIR